MGKKTKVENRLFTNQVITTGSIVSATVDVSGVDHISFHYVWSAGAGTPTGAFTFEVSNDGTNFVSYAHSPAATQSGDTGQFFAMLTNISTNSLSLYAGKYIRSRFTLTGGTSLTVNGTLFGKSLSD